MTPFQALLLADMAGQDQAVAEAREALYESYLCASRFVGWCWVAGWTFGAVLDALGAL